MWLSSRADLARSCHPDPRGAAIGVEEHGDVGHQGAQQPFAVARGGGVGVPEPGQVAGQGLQVGPGG